MSKNENILIGFFFLIGAMGCQTPQKSAIKNTTKPVIYQMMVRLFGNATTANKHYGSIQENGVGKFDDITNTALDSLKDLGATYIWYTGILEHATMTTYDEFGIKADDPDVVKGRAGSPYAIKDYYDVDPDLAVDVKSRMYEFQDLIDRTHERKLKVLIDFIPNHVAREYFSEAAPDSVISLGVNDSTNQAFSANNDFYYIAGKSFVVPVGVDAGGSDFVSKLKDGKFLEFPAKATGNNVFKPNPSIDDWYETVKLNYGVDVLNGDKKHFTLIPPVWKKMRDVLAFWTKKGVDGFRCDMAEMVPVEFWNWMIPQIKMINPDIIFIAEAYNPDQYSHYINYGHFDYLYNKVGLYDVLKKLIKNDSTANADEISKVIDFQKNFSSHMISFLENHDEERIASPSFAGDPVFSLPAMAVAATITNGPVLIYFGQEVGEKGSGNEGFGGEDGRTTIFDYWGVPAHQQWMNHGKFDGENLSAAQKKLRSFYRELLHLAKENSAVYNGKFLGLSNADFGSRQFAFLRYNDEQKVIVVANFDKEKNFETKLLLPETLFAKDKQYSIENIFTHETVKAKNEIDIKLKPNDFLLVVIK